ncbi:6-phosphogluconate dehydrogenase C-terminal domain-like protein [Macrolepiota fuliginosa MF-IS2]|uniref:6-phosphogluconate dehydrogenase C-terminal domain-like protein n=1 Tax=Macrolepiota fuliginosa MF-IS2 TaxID=1400762 RepID=A0A9P5XP11_9AGAR|nr:6-phosphogluconate dehydrogenase C-terminal domain-like protein [Macrolepiota fuliginosa MF-IS2]
MTPIISVIAAGAMGGGVARRLTDSGATVLTYLEGRSEQTRKRAQEAGVLDASLEEITQRSDFILSILPPRDAFSLAQRITQQLASHPRATDRQLIYADCNAVNVTTVKSISGLFEETSVAFVDACIIGGPPKGSHDPVFYGSVHPKDIEALRSFVGLSAWGLRTKALDGEGANIGDASALKMSYAGISKGLTGLMATMVLAAHSSSPATAEALISELNESQPELLHRLTVHLPRMLPKAYRWVGEMEEIAEFVGGGEGEIYRGLAKLYGRVENSIIGDGNDIRVLEQFVNAAEERLKGA